MADSHKKLWYSTLKFTSPNQPVVPYNGKPSNFKKFYLSLKASALKACPEMVQCMENQSFVEASDELNKSLYNWALGDVNQLNAERYF
jgi:hypothetical protein